MPGPTLRRRVVLGLLLPFSVFLAWLSTPSKEQAAGLSPRLERAVTVIGPPLSRIRQALPGDRTADLLVTVVDDRGAPAAGEVVVSGATQPLDDRGRALFRNLVVGAVWVEARIEGGQSTGVAPYGLSAGHNAVTLHSFSECGAHARVVDSSGTPVAGAWVEWEWLKSSGGAAESGSEGWVGSPDDIAPCGEYRHGVRVTVGDRTTDLATVSLELGQEGRIIVPEERSATVLVHWNGEPSAAPLYDRLGFMERDGRLTEEMTAAFGAALDGTVRLLSEEPGTWSVRSEAPFVPLWARVDGGVIELPPTPLDGAVHRYDLGDIVGARIDVKVQGAPAPPVGGLVRNGAWCVLTRDDEQRRCLGGGSPPWHFTWLGAPVDIDLKTTPAVLDASRWAVVSMTSGEGESMFVHLDPLHEDTASSHSGAWSTLGPYRSTRMAVPPGGWSVTLRNGPLFASWTLELAEGEVAELGVVELMDRAHVLETNCSLPDYALWTVASLTSGVRASWGRQGWMLVYGATEGQVVELYFRPARADFDPAGNGRVVRVEVQDGGRVDFDCQGLEE